MGNTCKPMAVSFQCMTKSTTNKKKKDLSDVCKKSHNISQSHYLMIQNIFRETKKKKFPFLINFHHLVPIEATL